mgnify:CR=1 FL=1
MGLPVTGILSLVDYIRQLREMQNVADTYTDEEDARQTAAMQTRMNTPEYAANFENTVRDENYGTIDPVAPWYVGPQTEDSERFKLGETMLPRRLDTLPVESPFTPAQLEALRQSIYVTPPEVGPMPEYGSGAGGDFMPRGNSKDALSMSLEMGVCQGVA